MILLKAWPWCNNHQLFFCCSHLWKLKSFDPSNWYLCLSANSNPCEHAGKCVNTDGAFHCECLKGYAGPRCEMDINECHSDPCQNDATCLDKIGGFTCLCMPGKWAHQHVGSREEGPFWTSLGRAFSILLQSDELCQHLISFADWGLEEVRVHKQTFLPQRVRQC